MYFSVVREGLVGNGTTRGSKSGCSRAPEEISIADVNRVYTRSAGRHSLCFGAS